MIKTGRTRFLASCMVSLPTLLALSLPAAADLTVTSEVHVLRPADPSQNQIGEARPDVTFNTTVYFQGDRARVERDDGTVTLFDLKAGRVYTLATVEKTYTSQLLSDFLKREPYAAMQDSGRIAGMKTDVKLDLKKDAVIESKDLAGIQAHAYDVSGSVTASPIPSSDSNNSGSAGGIFGGRGGGRRGGGGGAGGGGGNRASANAPTHLGQFDGEVWLSAPDALKSKTKFSWVPLLQVGLPSGKIVEAFAAKIAKSNGVPLSSKVTVTGAQSQSSAGVTVIATVKTVSEAPVDETLFKIPSDYQRLGGL